MRKFVFVYLFTWAWLSSASAEDKRFLGFQEGRQGLGVYLGQPTVVRYQKWLSWKRAYSYDLGYNLADSVILAQANYAFYFYDAKDLWKSTSVWNSSLLYAGPGLLAGLGLPGSDARNDSQLGVRAFAGIEYVITNSPWTVRAELAAAGFFKGRTTFNFQGMLGLTYYFPEKIKAKKKVKAEEITEDNLD